MPQPDAKVNVTWKNTPLSLIWLIRVAETFQDQPVVSAKDVRKLLGCSESASRDVLHAFLEVREMCRGGRISNRYIRRTGRPLKNIVRLFNVGGFSRKEAERVLLTSPRFKDLQKWRPSRKTVRIYVHVARVLREILSPSQTSPQAELTQCTNTGPCAQLHEGGDVIIVTGNTTSRHITIPSRPEPDKTQVPRKVTELALSKMSASEKALLRPFESTSTLPHREDSPFDKVDVEPLIDQVQTLSEQALPRLSSASATDKIMQILKEVPGDHRLKLLHLLKEEIYSECESCDGVTAVEQNNDGHIPKLASDFDLGSQGSPVTHLAFGKNLGHTIQWKDLLRILKCAPAGCEDLGLRARHMNVMATRNEPPQIHRMLELGSKLCKSFGLTGSNWRIFADRLGIFLRKVGTTALLQMNRRNEKLALTRLVRTTFLLCWQIGEKGAGLGEPISFEPTFPGARNIGGVASDYLKIREDDYAFVSFVILEKFQKQIGCA